jgi:hypothetical protein
VAVVADTLFIGCSEFLANLAPKQMTQYFIRRANTVSGPFTLRLLLAGIKIGKVIDTDNVGVSRTGPWLPVSVFRLKYADALDGDTQSSAGDSYFEAAASRRTTINTDPSEDREDLSAVSGTLTSVRKQANVISTFDGGHNMPDDEVAFLGAVFDPSFNHFVTPRVIRFLFILTAFIIAPLILIGAVLSLLMQGEAPAAIGAAIGGGLGYLLFVLYMRVASEIAIVLFRIERNTR